mmetsp:Transcript_65891/g.73532  ORF Transcript_65891/g.73532 Transcript_65891/m.73532 type:complete len:96 (+) Transcript_65891:356-643(+)
MTGPILCSKTLIRSVKCTEITNALKHNEQASPSVRISLLVCIHPKIQSHSFFEIISHHSISTLILYHVPTVPHTTLICQHQQHQHQQPIGTKPPN